MTIVKVVQLSTAGNHEKELNTWVQKYEDELDSVLVSASIGFAGAFGCFAIATLVFQSKKH